MRILHDEKTIVKNLNFFVEKSQFFDEIDFVEQRLLNILLFLSVNITPSLEKVVLTMQ